MKIKMVGQTPRGCINGINFLSALHLHFSTANDRLTVKTFPSCKAVYNILSPSHAVKRVLPDSRGWGWIGADPPPPWQLKEMFPAMDDEIIRSVLEARGGDKAAATSSLLELTAT